MEERSSSRWDDTYKCPEGKDNMTWRKMKSHSEKLRGLVYQGGMVLSLLPWERKKQHCQSNPSSGSLWNPLKYQSEYLLAPDKLV